MAEREAIKVEGLREVTRELRALEATAPAEVRRLNLKAAQTALPVIRSFAPVGTAEDRDLHPGQLRDSVKAGATQRSGYVKLDTHSKRIPYAGPVHFGWPAHNIIANPFMYEGLGDAQPAIVTEYERGMDELIRRVGLK